jgi:hypothetical protein
MRQERLVRIVAVGNRIDLRAAASEEGRGGPGRAFVVVDEYVHTVTGEPLLGQFLAVAPWVEADPVAEDAALTLEERRARLHAIGEELRPGGRRAAGGRQAGGRRANQYRESVVWADVAVSEES